MNRAQKTAAWGILCVLGYDLGRVAVDTVQRIDSLAQHGLLDVKWAARARGAILDTLFELTQQGKPFGPSGPLDPRSEEQKGKPS